MDDICRVYSPDQDSKALFSKAAQWLATIQPAAPFSAQKPEVIEKQLKDSIMRSIFGSNQIERAGLGWTRPSRSASEFWTVKTWKSPTREHPTFARGRGEVINHVKAFQFVLDRVVALDEPFSEKLLKDTHRTLCSDTAIDHHDGKGKVIGVTQAKEYAGIYRNVVVGAGNTLFTPPQFVPKKMKELVEQLNTDIQAAMEKKVIDPMSLAAKYSMDFVQIHPFQDGNGRFAGVVVPIGESKEDREEYMGIKKRASAEAADHGEYAVFVLNKCETRLRALKKKLTGRK
ncbi:hypothetical protein PG994_005360 [Apiospora phragmitis]|uniref:Fido domain-containing protein n=1 Tax=Apiospora phragmitis TaxID=2905665 RepID=A0ABR1VC15_9PEZI